MLAERREGKIIAEIFAYSKRTQRTRVKTLRMSRQKYRWAAPGDVNAFFGLMLDNIAGLILMVTLLATSFGFPADFAVSHMVPGTAIGVFVGDLAFFALAFHLARKTGRTDITAMPLGLDTPSTFGMVFFVLGPAFLAGKAGGMEVVAAAEYAWHIGIWSIIFSGVFKLICTPFSGIIRRVVPRAGLLGSLAAIALVLISFLPLLDIFAHPLPGFVALAVVLTSLIGRVPLPGKIPGTLAALLISGSVFYLMRACGVAGYEAGKVLETQWLPMEWQAVFQGNWVGAFQDAVNYLPVVLPFALGTVVGGIDCTESAAAAGDEYHTGTVVGIEAFATLVAGFCGGVIQTTPYIGHPAYKAMGGRAAYTLATACLIGSAGVVGYFGIILQWIPSAAVFPILVFVGLEITAQSFMATDRRYYSAIALACVPALAFLAINFPNQIFGDSQLFQGGITSATLADGELRTKLNTLGVLQGGFILVSLMWAWILSAVIDTKLKTASIVLLFTALFTLFGLIHSPLPGNNRIFLPFGPESWTGIVLPAELRPVTFEYAAGYIAAALLLFAWGWWLDAKGIKVEHHEHEAIDNEQPSPAH
jgi:adenine/guanine/hypoxanthine permease